MNPQHGTQHLSLEFPASPTPHLAWGALPGQPVPEGTTPEMLTSLFAPHGEVSSAVVMPGRAVGPGVGFATPPPVLGGAKVFCLCTPAPLKKTLLLEKCSKPVLS